MVSWCAMVRMGRSTYSNKERKHGVTLFVHGEGTIISYGHLISVKKCPKRRTLLGIAMRPFWVCDVLIAPIVIAMRSEKEHQVTQRDHVFLK